MPNNQGYQTQGELEEEQGVAGAATKVVDRGVATSDNQPPAEAQGEEWGGPTAEPPNAAAEPGAEATPPVDADQVAADAAAAATDEEE